MPQERDPGHGQITVKVRAIGICGSDLHWYLDGRQRARSCFYFPRAAESAQRTGRDGKN